MLAARRDPEMETVQLESRLTRLEAGVQHMGSDISEIKVQLHDLRTSMDAKFEVVNQRFDERFDAVNLKFEVLNNKFDQKLETLGERVDQKFAALDKKLDEANEKSERAIQRLENKIDARLTQHDQQFAQRDQRFETLLIAFDDRHAHLIEKIGEIKVWTLTVLGGGLGFGILGVLARALHWI